MSPDRPHHESGSFARARTEATRTITAQRVQAARTVADNSLDPADRDVLLSMLGLPPSEPEVIDETYLLARALRGYVRAVADAIGVPPEGTTCEVTDTVTAYLALARRDAAHPGRDLMLVWSERHGWAVSVETAPAEPPVVLSRLGEDLVPHPEIVARFVTESIAGPRRTLVALPSATDRPSLTERMERCVNRPTRTHLTQGHP